MNIKSKCSFERGKTRIDTDRSVLVGVQELLPRRRRQRLSASNFVAFHGCAVQLHE
jgi:hypothetical protein